MRCEWDECQLVADCEVHAQWTIADFVSYAACANHCLDVRDVLAKRLVDGERPLELWIGWYDTGATASLESQVKG